MPQGAVASFADDGWGVVCADDGDEHPFHSTALTDGSRHIEVGTAVTYEIHPGRQGRWEATAVSRR